MDEIIQMKQARINEFTENYLEKLFYFCLKRTGDSFEAEDLASDISLNILAALEKGLVPVHFSAWVWQSLLRRELSFISSDYRDIVVAYYIEDRKIQDIAASAALSEGTVKSKLFRARKKLKEGMNMAREFGTKSFKPEEVGFITSGNQPRGLPFGVLGRKLPKTAVLKLWITLGNNDYICCL